MKHNVGALAGKFEADFMSDARVRAGDESFFSVQSGFLRHEYRPILSFDGYCQTMA
jgi:hypothetical protein